MMIHTFVENQTIGQVYGMVRTLLFTWSAPLAVDCPFVPSPTMQHQFYHQRTLEKGLQEWRFR